MYKFRPGQIIKFMLIWGLLALTSSLQADETKLKTIDMEKDWGIHPVLLRITAEGYMIEFRYKVVDDRKALILSDRKDFPYMLSMKSQAKLSVPFGTTVGYLKSNRKFLKKGKNYIVMFSNNNRHMLQGDQVRIQVRDQVTPPITIDK